MVTLRPVLDAAQQAEGRIAPEVVVELDVVEILHRDPAEDGPRLLHVGRAPPHQLSD